MARNGTTSLVFIALSVLTLGSVHAQTPDQVAKFDATGIPVDSAITETNGNVGIGTSSPQATLHVVGTTPDLVLAESSISFNVISAVSRTPQGNALAGYANVGSSAYGVQGVM